MSVKKILLRKKKKENSALNFKVYLHSFVLIEIKLNAPCIYLCFLSVLKVRSVDFCPDLKLVMLLMIMFKL